MDLVHDRVSRDPVQILVHVLSSPKPPNFPTQKHPEIENFKPRKILRLLLSLEIHSIRPGICFQDKKNLFKNAKICSDQQYL